MPSHNHTATTDATGEHTHTLTAKWHWGSSAHASDAGWARDEATEQNKTNNTDSAGTHTHAVIVSNTGNGEAHNSMQPYIAVYMWKRIS